MLNKLNENSEILKKYIYRDKDTGKLKLTPVFFALIGALVIVVGLIGLTTYKNAQEIYVGDTKIGIIKGTKLTSEELTDTVIAKISGEEGGNIKPKEEINIKKVRASKNEFITLDYALNKISNLFEYTKEGATITVDGKEIVNLSSTKEAEEVLQQLKDKYIKEGVEVLEVDFVQDVKVTPKFLEEEEISTTQTAVELLTKSTNQEKKYQIKEGDTLYQVAIDHNISLEELFKANPEMNEDTVLKIGQEINLIVPIPLVSVKTVEKITYNDTVKRETETAYNDKQYKTYKKVLKEGSDGEKTVTASVTKLNGTEEKREIISEKITIEPVAQVVEVGTLNVPPKAAIGSFIYPISGRISSGFGSRSDGYHKGIDFSASYGTPVKASDGGTVVYAGYNGGYGNMVKINHGNGFQTIYAHNSKVAVSVGQKVAQGEVISYVGSTGNSTGNHLHFEVLKNGVSQNPLNYLK